MADTSNNTAELGPLSHAARHYGFSQRGAPLEIFEPISTTPSILVMGSIHGDESVSTVLLSECLRSIQADELQSSVILAANPDGVLAGTRCNSRGVDLNRNYPTPNWSSDPVYYRNQPGNPQNIALSPGTVAGSEQETMALVALIDALKPQLVVSLHGFLGCIDDPQASDIAKDLAERTQMELVPDVGYATPGSFGSWCAEQQIPIITYELPALGINDLRKIHLPVLKDLLTGHYNQQLNGDKILCA